MSCVRVSGIVLAFLGACLWGSLACAADDFDPHGYLGDPGPTESRPVIAAGRGGALADGANCGVISHGGDEISIWLGHFSGGRMEGGNAVWRDVYACFHSRASCQAWQKDQLKVWRGLDGYRSCLLIR